MSATIAREILRKVELIRILTRQSVTSLFAGEFESAFKGHGLEFEEVREYTPGDEIRTIDWNVTARSGYPHVKRYREERELSIYFLVDLSPSGEFGSSGKTRNEVAAEIVSVLSFSASMNNDRTALVLFSDEVELFIPPSKGSTHSLHMVRELLAHESTGEGTNIASALDFLGKVASRKSIVFLFSDFYDEGWTEKVRTSARKHDLVAMYLYDPLERSLPRAGVVDFTDPETGRTVTLDTGSKKVRIAYEKRFLSRLEKTEDRVREAFRRFSSSRHFAGVRSQPVAFFSLKERPAQGSRPVRAPAFVLCTILVFSFFACSRPDSPSDVAGRTETFSNASYLVELSYDPSPVPYGGDASVTLSCTYLLENPPDFKTMTDGLSQRIGNGVLLDMVEETPVHLEDGRIKKTFNISFEAYLPGTVVFPGFAIDSSDGPIVTEAIEFGFPGVEMKDGEGFEGLAELPVKKAVPILPFAAAGAGAAIIASFLIYGRGKKKRTTLPESAPEPPLSELIAGFAASYLYSRPSGSLREGFRRLDRILRGLEEKAPGESEKIDALRTLCSTARFSGRKSSFEAELRELRELFRAAEEISGERGGALK